MFGHHENKTTHELIRVIRYMKVKSPFIEGVRMTKLEVLQWLQQPSPSIDLFELVYYLCYRAFCVLKKF